MTFKDILVSIIAALLGVAVVLLANIYKETQKECVPTETTVVSYMPVIDQRHALKRVWI